MQSLGFHTAGQHFSARRSHGVVGTCQTGDRIQQNDYVVTAFHQTFGFLVYDIGYFHVVLRRFVEGRSNDLRIHAASHVRHFLRTFVYQKHDHIHLGVVLDNSVCQLFEQHGLTCLRLSHNQSALTFTDRCEQINNTHAQRVVLARAQTEFLVREEWGEVLESDTLFSHFGSQTVDTDHSIHREELVRLGVDAYRTLHGVSGLQSVLANLVFAHIHIIRAGQVVVVG